MSIVDFIRLEAAGAASRAWGGCALPAKARSEPPELAPSEFYDNSRRAKKLRYDAGSRRMVRRS